MAVYKSRRKDAAAQFIADARELRKYTVRVTRKFPKSYRDTTNGLAGKVREVMHPADHPPGHAAVRVGNCIMAAQEAW